MAATTSSQSIRRLRPVDPFYERTVFNGMSYGLGPNGYDIRIAEDLVIAPYSYALASSIERFEMPNNVMARVTDKSTWARRFLSIFNTTIDSGWKGWLTLELVNHSKDTISIEKGSPIAKIIFEKLDEPTDLEYDGIYQNQKSGPVPAKVQRDMPLFASHSVRQGIRC